MVVVGGGFYLSLTLVPPTGEGQCHVSGGTLWRSSPSTGKPDTALSHPTHTPGEAGPQPKLLWGQCRQAPGL